MSVLSVFHFYPRSPFLEGLEEKRLECPLTGQPEWGQLPGVLEAIQWPLCTETWSNLCLYYNGHNGPADNL